MFMQPDCGRRSPSVLLLSVLALGGAATPLRSQANTAASQEAGSTPPAYDVVSIKQASPGDRDVGWKTLPNGFEFRNLPLALLIHQAYGITLDSQISGLPEWAKTERYDVSARADDDTAEGWKKLSPKDSSKQQQLMLQALLADRCQLKLRSERKELPVYALVVASASLKMKEAAPDEKDFIDMASTTFHGPTGPSDEYMMTMTGHAVTAEGLAQNLPHYAGRMVVDKTSLGEKKFDFELKWSSGGADLPDAAQAGPSLFKALEEQLGLKLEPGREPVDTFIVEHIERPSAN
jgi:uncharacterized protein (TIGR03435 family)